jgi:hypothetical protein
MVSLNPDVLRRLEIVFLLGDFFQGLKSSTIKTYSGLSTASAPPPTGSSRPSNRSLTRASTWTASRSSKKIQVQSLLLLFYFPVVVVLDDCCCYYC